MTWSYRFGQVVGIIIIGWIIWRFRLGKKDEV